MQATITVTAEELFCEDDGHLSADADLSVTLDMQPAELPTRTYPGCPATVEVTGWSVDHYTIYDTDGHAVTEGPQNRTPKWLLGEIDRWVSENDEQLIEQACEEESAKAENWRY